MTILSLIESAKNDPAFGGECWLTFYLAGMPTQLEAISRDLEALGAKNLESADSGFIYAKVPSSLVDADIHEQISQVRKLAADADVRIDIIDLDSSSEVRSSKFYTLWTAAGA